MRGRLDRRLEISHQLAGRYHLVRLNLELLSGHGWPEDRDVGDWRKLDRGDWLGVEPFATQCGRNPRGQRFALVGVAVVATDEQERLGIEFLVVDTWQPVGQDLRLPVVDLSFHVGGDDFGAETVGLKEGPEPVILLLGHRVELVVVAPGTTESQPQ